MFCRPDRRKRIGHFRRGVGPIKLRAYCELLLSTLVQPTVVIDLSQLEVQCGCIRCETDRRFQLRLRCFHISFCLESTTKFLVDLGVLRSEDDRFCELLDSACRIALIG